MSMYPTHHQLRTSSATRAAKTSNNAARQAGFTIVELMIATVVFSTVLVIITAGVLYFTRGYYAGLNRSRTQNTARAIVSNISQGVQFTGKVITTSDGTGADYFCTGGKVYVFKTGDKYDGKPAASTAPGLYVAPQPSGSCGLPSDYNDPLALQLLAANMCISNLKLTSAGSQMYKISLTLTYGDLDLLAGTSSATSCAPASGATVACKSGEGSQFCAVSTLNATVQRRLQDGQLSQ